MHRMYSGPSDSFVQGSLERQPDKKKCTCITMPILGLQAAVYRVGKPATSGAERVDNLIQQPADHYKQP